MQINSKLLLGLVVKTQSGQKLGVVRSVNIDIENHLIKQYVVGLKAVPDFLAGELLISPTQVISINESEMVVEDAVISVAVPSNALSD